MVLVGRVEHVFSKPGRRPEMSNINPGYFKDLRYNQHFSCSNLKPCFAIWFSENLGRSYNSFGDVATISISPMKLTFQPIYGILGLYIYMKNISYHP